MCHSCVLYLSVQEAFDMHVREETGNKQRKGHDDANYSK